MVVPLPHHIELAEDYVHRGGPPVGQPYTKPWLDTCKREIMDSLEILLFMIMVAAIVAI